jgi:RHS repeat-associated protein
MPTAAAPPSALSKSGFVQFLVNKDFEVWKSRMNNDQIVYSLQTTSDSEKIFVFPYGFSPCCFWCVCLICLEWFSSIFIFLLCLCCISANGDTGGTHYIIEETIRAGVRTTVKTPVRGLPEITKEWTDPVSGENLKMTTRTESKILSNGWEKRTEYVKYGDGEWLVQSESVRNFLGELIASSRAGLGGTMLTTSNVYNNAGRLVQQVNHDGSSVVYNYGELYRRNASIQIGPGQTLDFNPQSFALADVIALDKYVISETKESIESKNSVLWRNLASISHRPGLNVLTTSVHKTQITGLSLSCNRKSISVDAYGKETVTTVSLNPTKVENVVEIVNAAFGTTNVFHYIAGYETVSTNSTGEVTEHEYDGFARRVKTRKLANSRVLEKIRTYHPDGTVATVGEVTAMGTNTTSYSQRQPVEGEPNAYKITVTDSQGNQTVNYYSGDDQVYRIEGATYPTATVRDSAGRMNQLHTWRSETDSSDVTRWYYDMFTGVMTNKCYADGNGTVYTYFDDGNAASREWARGVSTSYGYADTASVSVRTMEYSDSTPGVTNYFNLMEQLIVVEDGTGRTTLGYNSKDRLIAETNSFAVITRGYDSYGRYCSFTLTPFSVPDSPLSIYYSYDSLNRLSEIASIVGVKTNLYTYTYLPGTRLVSGYTASEGGAVASLYVSRSYEESRNLVTAITNSVSSVPSVVSAFNYIYDMTGNRISRIDHYNSAIITNRFSYNARNEITNAIVSLSKYNISYDDIGNRQTSTVNSVSSVYTVNKLNQYTTVNSSNCAVTITHDLDGNLTCDGSSWNYCYDAENRLVKSEPYSVTNGAYMLEYKYNYKNLRVEKLKKQMSGRESGYPMNPQADPGSWETVETRTYVWDGLNISAEIIIDHVSSATNISYYTWGLDNSGTLQGAGGIGGLLAETKVSSAGVDVYRSVGDANGNITEYIDDAGIVRAHYVYSITGQEIYSSGTMADSFTHRFSSKPYDSITRLVQFQFRPYDPIFNRWLSRDPKGEDGGINIYSAMMNNLINMIDPLGLDPVGEWIKKIYFRKWWWQRRLWDDERKYYRNDGAGNTMAKRTERQMDYFYFKKAKTEQLSASWKTYLLIPEKLSGEFWYINYDGGIDFENAGFWLYQCNQVEVLGGNYQARCNGSSIEIRNTKGRFRWNDKINSNANFNDLFKVKTFLPTVLEYLNEIPEYISGADFFLFIDWQDDNKKERRKKQSEIY